MTTTTPPPALIAFLATHEGRCQSCGFHERTQGHRDGCREGERRRDEAFARTEGADKAGEIARIDASIQRRVTARVQFSMNDLRDELATITRQPLIGSRVSAFASSGRIREVGRVRSTKANTHGHKISVWSAA